MKTFKNVNLETLYTLFDKDAKPKQEFSLLLVGVPGTGKSTWAARSFYRWHEETKLLDWGNEANWNPNELKKRIELEWAYGRGTLVIDDFGMLTNSQTHYGKSIAFQDTVLECIYSVWKARQHRNDIANMVLITNLLPNTFKERLGERALGRLTEMLPVVTLLDGIDFRNT